MPAGGERGHVEHAADLVAAALNGPLAALVSAVAAHRRDADQSADAAPVEGDGADQVCPGLVFRSRRDRLRELGLDGSDLRLHALQELLDVLPDFGVTVLQAVRVGDACGQEIHAQPSQAGEPLLIRGRQRNDLRLPDLREVGQRQRVDLIGLGVATHRPGELPHAHGFHDHRRQPCLTQRPEHPRLVAPRRLQRALLWIDGLQALHDLGNPDVGLARLRDLDRDVELALADVDPHVA